MNYQVSSNDDIFSLIKFDIIYILLQKYKLSFSDNKIQPVDYLPSYLVNHAYKLLLPILTFKFPSLGPKIYQILNKELEKFLESYEKIDKSENQIVDELALRILNEEGNIYEKNYLTDLIITKLQEIRGDKENVLILDDLDRLDPEHIFRLLNIFSAHFDYSIEQKEIYGENKFGFDKIIIVCDSKNLQNIYKHFYGTETDYSGYIDKFYSTKQYEFSSTDNLTSILKSVLENCKIKYEFIDSDGKTNFSRFHENDLHFVRSILLTLLYKGIITVRHLVKFLEKSYVIKKKTLRDFRSNVTVYNFQLVSLQIIELLILIIGNKDSLVAALEDLSDTHSNTDELNTQTFNMYFFVPLSQHIHKFKTGSKYLIEIRKDVIDTESYSNEMNLVENTRFGPIILKPVNRNYGNIEFLFKGVLESIKQYELLHFM